MCGRFYAIYALVSCMKEEREIGYQPLSMCLREWKRKAKRKGTNIYYDDADKMTKHFPFEKWQRIQKRQKMGLILISESILRSKLISHISDEWKKSNLSTNCTMGNNKKFFVKVVQSEKKGVSVDNEMATTTNVDVSILQFWFNR